MKIATEKGKRNPTPRQRKLARLMVDNGSTMFAKSSKELVLAAGYGAGKSVQPAVITRSPGFLTALDELGLTDEFVVASLVEDIRLKPQRRAFELSIAAKIRGLDRRADSVNNSTMSIQNAMIIIQQPDNGLTKPLLDNK